MIEGEVFNIQRFALHDGPGIRTTVFMRGCPLRCKWCHNPEGLVLGPGPDTTGVAPSRARFGTLSVAEVMDEVTQDQLFYEQSGGGVTFSGGEPLMQPDFLCALLESCRRLDFPTAVDTSGCSPADVMERVASLTDLILYDLKIIDDADHMAHVGVSNRVVLDNLRLLDRMGRDVQLRFPLVPGITDSMTNIDGLIEYLLGEVSFRHISVLPYHKWAVGKYERLGLPYELTDTAEPAAETLRDVASKFEQRGFAATIGR